MPGLSKKRRRGDTEVEVDMVPIMNMFLVLVPFLLMSASFFHIKAINTSVPVLGPASQEQPVDPELKAIVVVELNKSGFDLSLNAETLKAEDAAKWSREFHREDEAAFPFRMLAAHLERIKSAYPASDTLIIVPNGEVLYDTIIQTMDAARYHQTETKLFPNVVISGKIT